MGYKFKKEFYYIETRIFLYMYKNEIEKLFL